MKKCPECKEDYIGSLCYNCGYPYRDWNDEEDRLEEQSKEDTERATSHILTSTQVVQHRRYKRVEKLGDSLISAILIDYGIRNDIEKRKFSIYFRIGVTNEMLARVAKEINYVPPKYDKTMKNWANNYEFSVGRKFMKHGYGYAYDFVVDTLIKHMRDNGTLT